MKLLELYQLKNGFRYNLDSLLLFDFVSKFSPKAELLDIGCGNGVVGLLLKRDFDIILSGIDINKEAIKVAKNNAVKNNLEASYISGNISQALLNKKFDVLVSNPPFYHSNQKSKNQHLNSAKHVDSMPLADLFGFVNKHIKNKGVFYFCYEARSLQKVIIALSEKKFFLTHLQFVYSSATKPARLVLCEARKYQKSALHILPPLFIDEIFLDKIKSKANIKSL